MRSRRTVFSSTSAESDARRRSDEGEATTGADPAVEKEGGENSPHLRRSLRRRSSAGVGEEFAAAGSDSGIGWDPRRRESGENSGANLEEGKIEDLISSMLFLRDVKGPAYSKDQRKTAHPLCFPMVETSSHMLDPILTVGKGASFFKQLACYLGEPSFRAGIRRFLEHFIYGSTTVKHFIECISFASGRAVDSNWAKVWLGRSGISTVKPRWVCGPAFTHSALGESSLGESSKSRNVLSIMQIQQTAPVKQPTLRPMKMRIDLFFGAPLWHQEGAKKEKVYTYSFWANIQGELTTIPSLGCLPAPLGVLCNAGDFSYVKTLLDDKTLEFVSAQLQDIPNPLSRLIIWRVLWDMVRDRHLSALRFIHLALDKMPLEGNPVVLSGVHEKFLSALFFYLPDSHFFEHARLIADLSRRVVEEIERETPTTEHDWEHTALYRHWTSLWCVASHDLPNIQELLRRMDADESIDQGGIVHGLDPVQRWKVLERYCGIAEADFEEDVKRRVEEEAARDESERGRVGVQMCTVCRATREEKAELWKRFLDISNENLDVLYPLMSSFYCRAPYERNQQHSTLYTKLFFHEVRQVFAAKPRHLATLFWDLMFPLYSANSLTIYSILQLIQSLTAEEKVLKRRAVDAYEDLVRAKASRDLCLQESGEATPDVGDGAYTMDP